MNSSFLRSDIQEEFDDLETIRDELQEEIHTIDWEAEHTPTKKDKRSLALMVHDFYSGIERIFKTCISRIDGDLSDLEEEPDSHDRIIRRATSDDLSVRPPIVSSEHREILLDLKGFRHIIHHNYSHQLEWQQMKHFVENFNEMYKNLVGDINEFLDTIEELQEQFDQQQQQP